MSNYRCFFLNASNRVEAAEVIEAQTPTQAVEQALAILRERPQHRAIELWQGATLVYPMRSPPTD
jgi:hypothetical protein